MSSFSFLSNRCQPDDANDDRNPCYCPPETHSLGLPVVFSSGIRARVALDSAQPLKTRRCHRLAPSLRPSAGVLSVTGIYQQSTACMRGFDIESNAYDRVLPGPAVVSCLRISVPLGAAETSHHLTHGGIGVAGGNGTSREPTRHPTCECSVAGVSRRPLTCGGYGQPESRSLAVRCGLCGNTGDSIADPECKPCFRGE